MVTGSAWRREAITQSSIALCPAARLIRSFVAREQPLLNSRSRGRELLQSAKRAARHSAVQAAPKPHASRARTWPSITRCSSVTVSGSRSTPRVRACAASCSVSRSVSARCRPGARYGSERPAAARRPARRRAPARPPSGPDRDHRASSARSVSSTPMSRTQEIMSVRRSSAQCHWPGAASASGAPRTSSSAACSHRRWSG